jgi:hypothetical protein
MAGKLKEHAQEILATIKATPPEARICQVVRNKVMEFMPLGAEQ